MMNLYRDAIRMAERGGEQNRIMAAVVFKDLYQKTKHIQDTWDWVPKEDRDGLQPILDDLLKRIKELWKKKLF